MVGIPSEVRSDARNEDTTALLWRPKIGGIHHAYGCMVIDCGWICLKSLKVLQVALAGSDVVLDVAQTVLDPLQIGSKRRPCEVSDVFEQKRVGQRLMHGTNRLRPHVPRVRVSTLFPADPEWLTWWTATDERQFALKRSPYGLANVLVQHAPIFDVLDTFGAVVSHCLHGVVVPF